MSIIFSTLLWIKKQAGKPFYSVVMLLLPPDFSNSFFSNSTLLPLSSCVSTTLFDKCFPLPFPNPSSFYAVLEAFNTRPSQLPTCINQLLTRNWGRAHSVTMLPRAYLCRTIPHKRQAFLGGCATV